MFRRLKNLLATNHRPTPSARLGLEILEDRRVLTPFIDAGGNLRIDGTPGDDVCAVSYSPYPNPVTVVEMNGARTEFLRVIPSRVLFFGGEGSDQFDCDSEWDVIAYGGPGR